MERGRIMTEQQRKPGRPRIYTEARQRLTIELPEAIVQAIDAEADATGTSRTQIIERLLQEAVAATKREDAS